MLQIMSSVVAQVPSLMAFPRVNTTNRNIDVTSPLVDDTRYKLARESMWTKEGKVVDLQASGQECCYQTQLDLRRRVEFPDNRNRQDKHGNISNNIR